MTISEAKTKNFCPYAFGGLTICADGSFSPCWRSELILKNSNAYQKPLMSSFESAAFLSLRDQFLAGEKPESCRRCWRAEEAGQKSERLKALEAYGDRMPAGIEFLNPTLGNSCERACVHCGNACSSAWGKEELSFSKIPGNPFGKSYYGEHSYAPQWQAEDLRHLRGLYLWTTESLHQKAFPELLQLLEKSGRIADIEVHLETSGGFIPPAGVRTLLQKIRYLNVSLSIDAYGPLNHYIRFPTPWEKVEESVECWQRLCLANPDWTLRSTSTLSVLNTLGLDELRLWSQRRGLQDPVLNEIHFPWYLSLDILSPEWRESLAQRNSWEKVGNFLRRSRPVRNDLPLQPMGLQTMQQYLNAIDKSRGLSFREVHPELFEVYFSGK